MSAVPAVTLEDLSQALREGSSLRTQMSELRRISQQDWGKAVQDLWKQTHKRKKFNPDLAASLPGYTELSVLHLGQFNQKSSELKAASEANNTLTTSLATAVPVEALASGRAVYYQTLSSSYSTQGMGADKYARGMAQLQHKILLSLGMGGDLEDILRGDDKGQQRFVGVNVIAHTDEIGVEALQHKTTSFSFREQIKFLWSVGCNPRVFYPFLPHGFEESNGFDAFGREVEQPSGKAKS